MLFRINRVEAWGRLANQIIIYLEINDGKGGWTTRTPEGTDYCIRLTLPEAPTVITDLVAAYSGLMANVATELACGGCTTCNNTRWVNGVRCPVCWPRGEKRVHNKVFMPAPPGAHHA